MLIDEELIQIYNPGATHFNMRHLKGLQAVQDAVILDIKDQDHDETAIRKGEDVD